MEHFVTNLRQPDSILLLFIIGACLLGYGYAAYRDRATHGWAWLYWLFLVILAIVEEFILLFMS